jgi:hypothetical protein
MLGERGQTRSDLRDSQKRWLDCCGLPRGKASKPEGHRRACRGVTLPKKTEKPEIGPITPSALPGPSPKMTVDEGAAYVKTTRWAMVQAIAAGDLQAKKVGKRFVTTVQFLDEWYSRREDAASNLLSART